MDITIRRGERGPVAVAALALVVIAAALILNTWTGVRHQRELLTRHMLLSARVILTGAQAGLARSMRRMGPARPEASEPGGRTGRQRPGPGRPLSGPRPWFGPFAGEMFADLTGSGDVKFMALLDHDGTVISTGGGRLDYAPPPEAFAELAAQGSWHTLTTMDGEPVFILANLTRPMVARFCRPGPEGECAPGEAPRAFMLMGLGVGESMAHYAEFRRTAIYQTGFVIVAAGLLMLFFIAYLRRRDQRVRIRDLERFQARLLDDMPEGLVTAGAGGEVIAANPAAHEILSRPLGTLVGERLETLGLGGLEEIVSGSGQDWAERGVGGRDLEILARPLSGEGDGQRLLLLRDRTAYKAMERRLSEAEKLAAVGRMAAGVAHEIRNPLSALRGFAQFFAKKFRGASPESEYATTMVREADRLDKVVTDMLFLARPRQLEPRDVDAASALDEVRSLLAMDLEEKGVTMEIRPEIPTVYADPDALKQMLLNLMLNALAAVPANQPTMRALTEAAPGGVRVVLADNGPGFSEEALARGFEPFYTTHPSGTGLGLAIVHKLMQDHGGGVTLRNGPDGGAEVRLFFPDNPVVRRTEKPVPV